MKKGQAAMEFLMTYGWAIIVVLITIGALAYFGVLSPERIFGSSCILEPGLNCEDFKVDSEGVTLIIRNGLGVYITDVEVSLVVDLPEGINCNSVIDNDGINDGASKTYLITCPSGITEDALFKADINFKYKKSGFTLERTAIGSISAGVEGSGIIQVTSCGSISSPGNYKIMNLLSNSNTCITITSSNVELDCQNYQISGTGAINSYGIYTDGNDGAELTGVTIRDCDITGFDRGMNMEYTDNSFVYDSSFTSNAKSGIYLSYSDYNLLSNIEARGHSGTNDNGIGLLYATNNNLNSGTLDGNYYGIGMLGSATVNTAYNTITGFYIINNNQGVWIGNADVDNNRFYNNKFSNTNNFYVASGANNYWNTALTSGINIVGGPWIGGNYWNNFDEPLESCNDVNGDYICDNAYTLSGAGNVDNYPLIIP